MLITLITATLAALLIGQALPKAIAAAPVMWAHIPLALGALPLIIAAMQHFVPVLTRSGATERRLQPLPLLMLAAGGLAVGVFAGLLGFDWIALSALLALAGAVVMFAWIVRRGRRALGGPHPGLAWYLAAIGCLAAGLVAAVLIPYLPEWRGALREFHLHINLYGFIGLTAVGTLQVLMPTAVGQFDTKVGARLRTDLKWALAGSLALAVGQALYLPLAWGGALLWAWVLGRMLWAWWKLHRGLLFALHGAPPVLLASVLGLLAALYADAAQLPHIATLGLFLPGFLMPLVTGAAGVLAPVWLHLGKPAAMHQRGQAKLNRWAGIRAVFFLTAAVLPLLGFKCSGMPALTALVWFGLVFLVWLWREA